MLKDPAAQKYQDQSAGFKYIITRKLSRSQEEPESPDGGGDHGKDAPEKGNQGITVVEPVRVPVLQRLLHFPEGSHKVRVHKERDRQKGKGKGNIEQVHGSIGKQQGSDIGRPGQKTPDQGPLFLAPDDSFGRKKSPVFTDILGTDMDPAFFIKVFMQPVISGIPSLQRNLLMTGIKRLKDNTYNIIAQPTKTK
jgi:hypothetical protein